MGKLLIRDMDKPINAELLTEQLHSALGDVFISVLPLNGKTRITLNSPTESDVTIATQIIQAHNATDQTTAQQTFMTIKNLLQGTVGKNVLDLTNGERWALLAGLLYHNQAIAQDMTIRPLSAWIARQDVNDD